VYWHIILPLAVFLNVMIWGDPKYFMGKVSMIAVIVVHFMTRAYLLKVLMMRELKKAGVYIV